MTITARNGITRMAGILAVVIASVLAMACDGGLFGTGDGTVVSAEIDASDPGTPGGIATDPDDGSQGTPEEGENEEGDTVTSPADTIEGTTPGLTLSFSNTLPSGLTSQTAPLPAFKVINLSADAVNVAAVGTPATAIGKDVQPDTTSELLSINIGETDISFATVDDGARFASVSPLNSAEDSLTSFVVSGSIDNPDSIFVTSDSSAPTVLALETRAAVSASGMAEVRLIRLAALPPGEPEADNTASITSLYLLTPDENNTGGVELAVKAPEDSGVFVGSYQLTAPGNYTLSSNGETPLSLLITFEANSVYTLIVTSDPQRPVFVEVDSTLVTD